MFNNQTKIRVVKLRQSGKSLEEIRRAMNISKGTLSVWLKDVVLDEKATKRLTLRQIEGRKKVSAILSERKDLREKDAQLIAKSTLKAIPVNTKEQDKLTCALIYYCEGAKSDQRMSFTNSDPDLMRAFLSLFRKSFLLDESRFRVQIHLHSYHNEKTQKSFWSKATDIPEANFIKSFRKKEGSIFKKKDYPGCATVRYHDAAISRELLETARQYFATVTY